MGETEFQKWWDGQFLSAAPSDVGLRMLPSDMFAYSRVAWNAALEAASKECRRISQRWEDEAEQGAIEFEEAIEALEEDIP